MTGKFAFLSFFSMALIGLCGVAEASSSGGTSSASSLARSRIVAGVVRDVAGRGLPATIGTSPIGGGSGGSMFGSSGSLLPAGTSVGGGLSAASAVRTFQNLNKFGLSSGQIKNNQAEQIKKLIALAAAAFRR